jgi:hypothetical protein
VILLVLRCCSPIVDANSIYMLTQATPTSQISYHLFGTSHMQVKANIG